MRPTSTIDKPKRRTIDTARYRLTLEGISPLLMHSTALMSEPRTSNPAQFERENFRRLAYTVDGVVVIPAQNIRKCLIDGAPFAPAKPRGARRSFAPLIEAAVIVLDDAELGIDPGALVPVAHFVSANPTRPHSGRVERVRPSVPMPWSASTSIEVYDPEITLDVLQVVLDAAGTRVGICDGRRIGYGKFIATVEVQP